MNTVEIFRYIARTYTVDKNGNSFCFERVRLKACFLAPLTRRAGTCTLQLTRRVCTTPACPIMRHFLRTLQDARIKRDTLRELYDKYGGWISVGGKQSKVRLARREKYLGVVSRSEGGDALAGGVLRA